MVSGRDLGVLAPLLRADRHGRGAYDEMVRSAEFRNPLRWDDIRTADFAGVVLPGGHAPGMKAYLESSLLQARVVEFFDARKPVGAICHGVVLAARSRTAQGRSVLWDRRTTALTRTLELTGWWLTRLWLGDYYRTYSETVEGEVRECLATPSQFESGPLALRRDGPDDLSPGFVVRDGPYLSARWPGDAHRFAASLVEELAR